MEHKEDLFLEEEDKGINIFYLIKNFLFKELKKKENKEYLN